MMGKINSKIITDSIKAQIIHLANVLQIERECTTDESIEYVREFLIAQHNALMSEEWKRKVGSLRNVITDEIAFGKASDETKTVYKLLKYLGLK